MIKYQYKRLLALVLLLLSPICLAEVSDASLNRILDLSGLTKQVAQFPANIKLGMEQTRQQESPIADADFNSIVNSVDESILPSEILNDVKTSLKSSLNEAEAQQLLAWYESNLGKEITLAEETASTPEAAQQMMREAPALLQDSQKVAFARTLDELLGSTEMVLDLQEYSGIAIYAAISGALQPEVPLDYEQVKAQMAEASLQSRDTVEEMVTLSYVYAYRDIDAGKLKKYEEFLRKPATVKFNNAAIQGLNNGLESSISKWAGSISTKLKNKGPQNQQA